MHRDGSAVELVGLCASVTRWLADINEQGAYPYSGVKRPSKGLHLHCLHSIWCCRYIDKKVKV